MNNIDFYNVLYDMKELSKTVDLNLIKTLPISYDLTDVEKCLIFIYRSRKKTEAIEDTTECKNCYQRYCVCKRYLIK